MMLWADECLTGWLSLFLYIEYHPAVPMEHFPLDLLDVSGPYFK